jgi:nitrogen fixation protein
MVVVAPVAPPILMVVALELPNATVLLAAESRVNVPAVDRTVRLPLSVPQVEVPCAVIVSAWLAAGWIWAVLEVPNVSAVPESVVVL